MSDLNILSQKTTTKYREAPVYVDPEEFEKLINSRRSVRLFKEDKIPEEIIHKCIDAALKAPNSSNLQPWQFYRVKDFKKKKELAHYCLDQNAATSAAELIVCVTRLDKWKEIKNDMIKEFDQSEDEVPEIAYKYYQKIVPFVYTQGPFSILGYLKRILFFFVGLFKVVPREPGSYSDMRVWGHKSVALGCENLMLALRAYGYDSCPMEGFDSKRIKKLLNLPRKAEICMVIGAGRRAEEGIYARQIRMPKEKFYFEV